MKNFTQSLRSFFTIAVFSIILSALTLQLNAQISYGGTPESFKLSKGENGTTTVSFDEIILRSPNVDLLRSEDIQSGKDGTPPRVGVSLPLSADKTTAGNWTDMPDGGRLWTLKISVVNATALSIFFDSFHLAPGSKLFFYNENKKQVIGAFTSKNNLDNNTFATEMVQGESIYIEYYEPKRIAGESYFHIASVGYFYEELAGLSKYKDDQTKTVGASDACEVNINCSPVGDNWQDEKRGVAQITFLAGGSWYLCSGTLVNNTAYDQTPYFLTAFHCGAADATAAELNQWVFKFRYEAVGCTDPGSEPATNSITGCVRRAEGNISGGSDFFLVQMNSTPTAAFQPYYNGWDRTGTTTSTGAGIHHPSGDIKKISTYGSIVNSGSHNISGDIMGANTAFTVGWVSNANGWGVTEGGSSGSPLFNSNGLQIGTLTGGSSYCTDQTATDIYGRFSYHWLSNGATSAYRLQPWLDPAGTTTTLPGYDPFATAPPTVDFEGYPTTVIQGSSVDFYNYTTNSPTSHSWTFENGTPGTSTDINPTGIVYNVIGTHDVTLTSSNANGPSTLTKTNYIEVIDPASSFCDTLSQFCCNPAIYTSAAGYVGGTNEYDCLGIAEFFSTFDPYNQVTGMRVFLAAANNGTSPNVTFAMWDNVAGSPGTQLTSTTIPMATVVTAYNGDGYIDINFPATINIPPGGFFVGFMVPGTPASGDTLAVLTNTDEDSGYDTGYSLYGTSWETYAAWSMSLQNAIFPFTCYEGTLPPVADFVGVPDRIPVGNTVQFSDASVGTPATTWSWTFAGGTPATSTEENPLVTYSALGLYDVTLIVTNANGTDTETKVGYIEVYDPNGITAFDLDFEPCADFVLDNFTPWTTYDGDATACWGVSGFDFPNEGYTGALIAFNSTATTPPATGWEAHGGDRCGAFFAANGAVNNDWLITDHITLGTGSSITFWAKSASATYPTERFNVKISTTTNAVASFTTNLSGTITTTTTWTQYTYSLAAYDGDPVYIAIQCVSNDQFALLIDDIEINSTYPPPVADFVADQTNVPMGTTVNFTDLSTAMPTSWSWSFPGGTPATSTAQNPSIVYNTLGTYNVSVTVTNASGTDSETKTGYITVTEVPDVIVEWNFPNVTDNNVADAGIAVNLTKTILPFGGVNDILYTAAGVTTRSIGGETWATGSGTKGWQVLFNTVGYGTLKLSYAQMSDNATSPRDFKIQYSTNGSTWTDLGHNITLVEDVWTTGTNLMLPVACENQANLYVRWIMTSNTGCGGGAVANTSTTRRNYMDNIVVTGIPLSTPPVANFTASSTTICAGQAVTYTDASTGTPTSWAWTFAGGTPATSTNQNPVITYNTAGTYTAELTATNASGSDTETKVSFITVNALPTAPTSVTATQTTICNGASTTLSYVGGSGTTFAWFTASCGGTAVGSGNNLVVSPTTTTTYYGRWENTCGNSTCQSVTITVNPLPVAPTSVTATQTTICNGASTTLSYVGGSGTTFTWYTASCGGTSVGTGNNLVVSPSTTTTYYGRWGNTCGNSTCQSVTITVNPLPVAPTSVTATQTTICNGASTTLSYVGGSGTTFAWYSSSCGVTSVGSGNNLVVSPTTTTTYYGRWENTCGNSTCQSVTITVNPLSVAPTSVTATQTTICNGASTTLSYIGGSGTTFAWYSSSCGVTAVGSGNNLVVSPTTTTTYYGRWENTCGNSTCQTVTITVNPLPVAPTSVSASIPIICDGESSSLTYSGGSGTVFNWYTVSCGGTIAGTGNNLLVSPTTTTIYYGRWENSCGSSACQTATVTVNPLPEAPIESVDCSGGAGNAIITITSPTGAGYEYSLNGGTFQSSTVFNSVINGSYVVTARNSGCETDGSSFNVSCGCATPTTINIPVANASTCGTTAYTLTNNTFGGSATQVTLTHNGFGTFTQSVFGTSPFSFTYTPHANDNGNVVTITATTDNPSGAPCSASSMNLLLTVNPLPTAATSASASISTICVGSSTDLSYIGGSGTTFNWYTSSCGGTLVGAGNNLTVSPVVTTTYYGRWENSCGNSTCQSVTVNVTQLPVSATSASASIPTICPSENTVLSYIGGSGSTFNWYTSSCGGTLVGTGNDLTVAPAITTTYYGRWENSCSNSSCQTVEVTVNPLPVAPVSTSASFTTICDGETTVLSYVGGSGSTFNWYSESCGGILVGSGNDLNVMPSITTTYYGRWENSCGNSTCEMITITVNPLPIEPISVSATNTTICNGESTDLTINGGSGTTFNWYTGSCGGVLVGSGNNFTVFPVGTTTYFGRWESTCGVSGCQSVEIIVLPLPIEATTVAATNMTICQGESSELSYIGGNGNVFNWYSESCGGTLVGSGNNLSVSPSTTTTYYGSWENSCGTSICLDVTVNVNDLPELPVHSVDCSGGVGNAQISILSPLGINYTYSIDGITFQTEPLFTGIADGTHELTVELFGCLVTGNAFTIDCACSNPPVLTLSSIDPILCEGEVLTASGNLFGGSATEVNITHDGTGVLDQNYFNVSPFEFIYTPDVSEIGSTITFTITTNNPNGVPCTVAQENIAVTIAAKPVLDLPETQPACAEEEFTYTLLGSYTSIYWIDESTESTFTTTYAFTGNYDVWVIVTNENCESTDTMTVIVDICENINGVDGGIKLDLYPNPTRNNCQLSISDYSGDLTYTLMDIQGKELSNKQLNIQSEFIELIDVKSLLPGMYYLRVTTANETFNYKVIKE